MRLKNKVAIVTGGSRGIGYATVERFLQEGATVVLTASSDATAKKAVEQLKEKYPLANVTEISPNLTDLADVRDAFGHIAQQYGTIDILVNNAGVSESTSFENYTDDLFDKVMDLNVKGVFNATRAAAEYMTKRGEGVILNTSSMVSITGLSCLKICRQRYDRFVGKRTGTQGHPSQCGCPRDHRNRYDESSPQRSHRSYDQPYPTAPPGTARGHRQRFCVPGI